MTDSPKLHIDIVSDVVCPWCVVGYKTLERALIEVGLLGDTTIHFRPFELNPYMPEGGQDLGEHLRMKYGTNSAQSKATRGRLQALGDELGFEFAFGEGMRTYNTHKAHQLLHWAGELGRQAELKLALFDAYFTKRENVDDVETLVRVAARAGLDEEEARGVLYDERYAALVREEEETWRDKGIHAVPSFVINDRMLLTGAQDQGAFVRALNTAIERAEAAAEES